MTEIYYKEGIYIAIENENIVNNHCECIYSSYKWSSFLFGNRINISHTRTNEACLTIDDIPIIEVKSKTVSDFNQYLNYSINSYLSLTTIASHLNAIEVNGVDTFMENYKHNVEFLYSELKDAAQKTEFILSSEQNNSEIKELLSQLDKIKDSLLFVLVVLFNLKNYMNAGLENEKVMTVYQLITDLLA